MAELGSGKYDLDRFFRCDQGLVGRGLALTPYRFASASRSFRTMLGIYVASYASSSFEGLLTL
jgi:hypothetical protein